MHRRCQGEGRGNARPALRFAGCPWSRQAHLAGREVAEESSLGLPAEATCDQVYDLGNDEGRDDQGAGMSLQQLEARLVMSVVAVHIGVKWPGVNDEGYGPAPR